MSDLCIIGVPKEDESDLTALANSLGYSGELEQQHYFDGATFIEMIVPIATSGATWMTLRTWIKARADVLKVTRVSFNGIEIVGMKPKDADRIIRLINSSNDSQEEDDEHDD